MTEVRLPELAESMTTAIITTWLKQAGDFVDQGEPLVEVDIDKTTVELEAPASGVLAEIRVPDGTEDVPVGSVLAVIDEQAPRPDVSGATEAAEKDTGVVPLSPTASRASPTPDASVSAASVDATPLARRMAELAGLDLSSVRGTGPGGRVLKSDVDEMRRP